MGCRAGLGDRAGETPALRWLRSLGASPGFCATPDFRPGLTYAAPAELVLIAGGRPALSRIMCYGGPGEIRLCCPHL